jgi:hypothetical protein
MDDPAPKNTTADFLAWGRYVEEMLKTPLKPGERIEYTQPMLTYYLTAANEALRQQLERERKARRKSGRPAGGMGEMKRRLRDANVPEEKADQITAKAFGKPVEAVQRAYDTLIRKKPID